MIFNQRCIERVTAMNTKKLVDTALLGLDNLGYQLENLGITNKVNRHTLIAFAMAEKNRFEGEMDSVNARLAHYRYLAESTADFALKPARAATDTVRGLLRQKA